MAHLYTVEFRIYSEHLVPTDITDRLGLVPCNAVEIGAHGAREGNKHQWCFNGTSDPPVEDPEWDELEDGLQFVSAQLQPKKLILAELRKMTEQIWWCGHYQSSFDGGPLLSASVLAQLSEIGAPLYIDNYFSSEGA
jgi:hypothetical protein